MSKRDESLRSSQLLIFCDAFVESDADQMYIISCRLFLQQGCAKECRHNNDSTADKRSKRECGDADLASSAGAS